MVDFPASELLVYSSVVVEIPGNASLKMSMDSRNPHPGWEVDRPDLVDFVGKKRVLPTKRRCKNRPKTEI